MRRNPLSGGLFEWTDFLWKPGALPTPLSQHWLPSKQLMFLWQRPKLQRYPKFLWFQKFQKGSTTVLLGSLLSVSVIGAFSAAPGLEQEASDFKQSVSLKYSLLSPLKTITTVKINLKVPSDSTETLELWVDENYLDSMDILQMIPQPERVEYDRNRAYFTFRLIPFQKALNVSLRIRPQRLGFVTGRFGQTDQKWVEISQFVHP